MTLREVVGVYSVEPLSKSLVTLPKSHTNSPPTLPNGKGPTFYKNKTKILMGLARGVNRFYEVFFRFSVATSVLCWM
jgi:hypothetical protein